MGQDQLVFDDFIVATILAEIFDPEENDNLDLVSSKIIKGLSQNELFSYQERKSIERLDNRKRIYKEDDIFAA